MFNTRLAAILRRFEQNPNEKTLEIDNLTLDENLSQLLTNRALQNLEKIVLKDSFFSDAESAKELANTISNLPHLKTLVFSACTFTPEVSDVFVICSKQLEKIEFSYINQKDIATLLNHFSKETSLQTVVISALEIGKELDESLGALIQNGTLLREITIEECMVNCDLSNLVKAYQQSSQIIDFIFDESVDEDKKQLLNNHTALLDLMNASTENSHFSLLTFFESKKADNEFTQQFFAEENQHIAKQAINSLPAGIYSQLKLTFNQKLVENNRSKLFQIK